jgi:hypothetical protein
MTVGTWHHRDCYPYSNGSDNVADAPKQRREVSIAHRKAGAGDPSEFRPTRQPTSIARTLLQLAEAGQL